MNDKDVLTKQFLSTLKPIDELYKVAKSATVTHIGGAKVIGFPKPVKKPKKTMKKHLTKRSKRIKLKY